jgi:hypothetical protein
MKILQLRARTRGVSASDARARSSAPPRGAAHQLAGTAAPHAWRCGSRALRTSPEKKAPIQISSPGRQTHEFAFTFGSPRRALILRRPGPGRLARIYRPDAGARKWSANRVPANSFASTLAKWTTDVRGR